MENAKDMIYPRGGGVKEEDQIREMYRKTHGNFAPGEQRKRDYEWKFDPADHRFGFGEKANMNGAAAAIHNERNHEQFPQTVIIKKPVEDYRAVSTDILGQSKNLG